jgi:hypothetical protein
VAKQTRSAQLNMRITPRMKQRVDELAMEQQLSVTELIVRAFDVYALGLFTPRHQELLNLISETLGATPARAFFGCALEDQLLAFARVARFFGGEIETSPGSRLSHAEVWAAYREWCRLHRLGGRISPDKFATMALLVCNTKKIAVRVRDNQVACLDVRLNQTPDAGKKKDA